MNAAALIFCNFAVIVVASPVFEGIVDVLDACFVQIAAEMVVSLVDLLVWLGLEDHQAVLLKTHLVEDGYLEVVF